MNQGKAVSVNGSSGSMYTVVIIKSKVSEPEGNKNSEGQSLEHEPSI